MGDNTFLTAFGNGSHSKDPASGHNGLASIGSQQERARQTVAVLFGDDGAKLTANRSIDLDNVYGSAPHSSLGLQVAIAGRATVVQADVAAHLLEHQDPIRSILGVSIADSHRVIIKRRFVYVQCPLCRSCACNSHQVQPQDGRRRGNHPGARPWAYSEREGGGARGRARTLRCRVRRLPIQCHCNASTFSPHSSHSLEMNTNLLLEPGLAKADLDIKLNCRLRH